MTFRAEVSQTIKRNSLPGAGTRLLVAVSGGADSVALLRVLLSLGYSCDAAHCNFRLRGEESERDEHFVRNLCARLNVTLHVERFNTHSYATEKRISIEMAARELRYAFFDRVIRACNIDFVAVAHHMDDNAETLLLNLIRGTGVRGLCGMKYQNSKVIRPLLDVSRADITNYLREIGQDYIIDSSNLRADVMRNKIRLRVMPLLRDLNPSVSETLHLTTQKMREAEKMYRFATNKALELIVHCECGDEELNMSAIPPDLSVESLLYEWLFPAGFNETEIFEVREAMREHNIARFETSDRILFLWGDKIRLSRKDSFPIFEKVKLPYNGEIIAGESFVVSVEHCVPPVAAEELRDPRYAFFEAAALNPPLFIRPVRIGDRFVPFGMKGSKLVSDYLANGKIPTWERMRQLVVVDTKNILWLVNRRISDLVKVTTTTQEIIKLSVCRQSSDFAV